MVSNIGISKADADLIVVGSGVAGLTAALTAAEEGASVLVVTAGDVVSGSSWWAQGGIAAAVGEDDEPAYHAEDTFAVGAELNDIQAVQVLVEEGKQAALDLLSMGVPFDHDSHGLELGLEAGHHHRRILHAGGGATGAAVSEVLLEKVREHSRITIKAKTPIHSLLMEGCRAVGVVNGGHNYASKAVVLATGGYAGLWGRTTNPTYNTGLGTYLAWQAGASLADLEFVQFHPTALNLPGAPAYLLSEAIRGEGARLVNAEGIDLMDPLLPRDVLARAVARYLYSAGPVYLSLRHLNPDFVVERFPNIAAQLRTWGLDMARDLLPIAPAAHYCMGGVRSDIDGRTDVAGLYVAGEVACTGVQGANRLASNSLLECLVFGRRAAVSAMSDNTGRHAEWPTEALPGAKYPQASSSGDKPYTVDALGARLDRDLGVERDAEALRRLISDLPLPEAANVPHGQAIAGLAARAALLREESRGAHYRVDAPETLPEWQGRIIWRRDALSQFEEVPSWHKAATLV